MSSSISFPGSSGPHQKFPMEGADIQFVVHDASYLSKFMITGTYSFGLFAEYSTSRRGENTIQRCRSLDVSCNTPCDAGNSELS